MHHSHRKGGQVEVEYLLSGLLTVAVRNGLLWVGLLLQLHLHSNQKTQRRSTSHPLGFHDRHTLHASAGFVWVTTVVKNSESEEIH